MSLFEDARFQWRETYFVLFDAENRPTAAAMRNALDDPPGANEINHVTASSKGEFESLTLVAHADGSGMDVSYVGGDDVADSIAELNEQIDITALGKQQAALLAKAKAATARVDIYHFEEVAPDGEDDALLDPGALLLVLQRVCTLCDGVGFDPQSGEML